MILDGIAASAAPSDIALRATIRSELPDATIIFAATDGVAEDAGLTVEIDEDGSARTSSAAPSRGQADETGGRQAT
jgi:ABC-type nitrate/sulfonate/bicarbonate transport system substrate-binding protein